LLYLKNAQRKFLSVDNDSGYKNIDGHIIILKYDHIININLSFIQVEEIGEESIELRLIE